MDKKAPDITKFRVGDLIQYPFGKTPLYEIFEVIEIDMEDRSVRFRIINDPYDNFRQFLLYDKGLTAWFSKSVEIYRTDEEKAFIY